MNWVESKTYDLKIGFVIIAIEFDEYEGLNNKALVKVLLSGFISDIVEGVA